MYFKGDWGLPKERLFVDLLRITRIFFCTSKSHVAYNENEVTRGILHTKIILITFHSYFCNKDVRKQLRKMNGNATEKNRKDCLKKIWESSSSIPNPFSKALFLKDIVRWGFSFNPFNYLLPITKGMKTRVVDSHYSMVINCQRKTRDILLESLKKVWNLILVIGL